MNVVRNTVWLGLLFAFIFAFGFLWYVVPQIEDKIYAATNAATPSATNDRVYLDYLAMKAMLITGFYVIASLLVFFTLVSSMFDSQTFGGYLLSVFGGLIATPIVIYIVSTFWSTYNLAGLVTFNEISLTFINSFSTIMLANLIAGLLSFVFMRKSGTTQAFT